MNNNMKCIIMNIINNDDSNMIRIIVIINV